MSKCNISALEFAGVSKSFLIKKKTITALESCFTSKLMFILAVCLDGLEANNLKFPVTNNSESEDAALI